MTSRIASIANFAYQLFGQGAACVSKEGLAKLLHQLASVTAKDVDFDSRLVTDVSRVHAPVVYVHIVENDVFSMGIFVLRPGARIPLHDHPSMFGLCKPLHGSMRCRAYTATKAKQRADSAAARLQQRWRRDPLQTMVIARLDTDAELTVHSQPVLLTPSESNYHELQALGDGAAFLDILAPPYDHDLGRRECRYYTELSLPPDSLHAAPDAICLVEIPQPRDFVCNTVEYTGPKVT